MLSKHFLIWSSVLAASTAIVKAAYFGLWMLLATLLAPASYANFALLYAGQTAVSMFGGVGAQETTIGRLTRAPADERTAMFNGAVALFYVTTSAAIVFGGTLMFLVLPDAISFEAILFALLLGGVTAFGALQASLLRLEERHGTALIFSVGIPLSSCIGSAIGAYLFESMEAIFAVGLLGGLVSVVALGLYRHGYYSRWPRTFSIRNDLWPLAPFFAIAVIGWFGGYGITFLIHGLFDPIDVARYTFLFTLGSVAQMIATAMNMVWSPKFYKMYAQRSGADLEEENRHFTVLQASILAVTGAAGVALLPWFTTLMGGNVSQYGSLRVELGLLFAGYVLTVPWWHCQNYYLIENEGRRLMHYMLWSGALGLAAWFLCMVVFGSVGIYIGFVLQCVVKSLAVSGGAIRQWEIRVPWTRIGIAAALIFFGLTVPLGMDQ